jgi:hypothetical protein
MYYLRKSHDSLNIKVHVDNLISYHVVGCSKLVINWFVTNLCHKFYKPNKQNISILKKKNISIMVLFQQNISVELKF